MAKRKKGFGTYSNDGLGSIDYGFSEEDIIKARNIVDEDLSKIKIDFEEQLSRMKNYLEDKKIAIPKTQDFANWFFDNKKIWQTGKKLPEITTEQMVFFISEHHKYVDNFFTSKDKLHNEKEESINSIKWIKSDEKLFNLYNQLISQNFISIETTFEDFKFIFSGVKISSISNKIIWLKIAKKNKKPNKKSISDFINLLTDHNYINELDSYIPKILSHSFTSTNTELTFFHSNLSKDGDYSEFIIDLEKIIKSL